MTSWPDDPEATAVILEDVGEVEFVGDFNLVLKRFRRIKVLSRSAYDDWGTITIPYYAKDGGQKVESIQGMTTNREGDGSITHAHLEDESIFTEDVDRTYRQIRFTMPDLRPGCIIEYRYTVKSRGATFLNSWEFGASQPTRRSEFVATIPDNLEYIMVKLGMTRFSSETKKKAGWPSRLDGYESALKYGVGQTRYSWTMNNVPAIREAEFITTTGDYIPRVRFQLSRWSWPGSEGVDVIKNWETIARDYRDNMRSCPAAEGVAKKLARDIADPRERMVAIFKYVRRTMSVDRSGTGGGANLCAAFKARKGTTEDIATLLTTMLQKADLQAFPVLISTRKNGKPIDIYPMASQFNRVLTLVLIDDREYLLDASDPQRPMGLLPMEAMNGTGFVADPDDPRWVDIPAGNSRTVVAARAAISDEGAVSGFLKSASTGYAALQARHELLEESEDEFVARVWTSRFKTGTVDSATVAGKDSLDMPLVTSVHFSDAATVDPNTRRIYCGPVFGNAAHENPFRPGRILPADFGFTLEKSYTLTLDLPEGYALETIPKDIRFVLPDSAGYLMREVDVVPGQVHFHRELVLARPRFETNHLEPLRQCYDRLIAIDSEQFVLVKHSTAGQ
ncbi:MAG: hypothetical protein FD129_450 [bacterium]|nr:MAG: hypothetical protein FD129_450 [bacterium]